VPAKVVVHVYTRVPDSCAQALARSAAVCCGCSLLGISLV
jgi:hypothetical protein